MGRWKGIKIRLKNNKKWITYVLIAIIIGAYCYGFAFLTSDFLKRELITENGKYEILRDLIGILLAVTGIVGYAIYITMSKLIEKRVKTYAEELHNRSVAATKVQVGFLNWKEYKKKKHRDKKSKLKILKKNVIFNTKIAYQFSLKLDEEKRQTFVAGVPPDYFSQTGQLWGNPVYNWDVLKKEGFSWWIQRMDHTLKLYDVVRIDHFRGLVAYWEVPAGESWLSHFF